MAICVGSQLRRTFRLKGTRPSGLELVGGSQHSRPACPGRRRCPRFLISSATTSRTLVGLTIGVAAIRFAARERRAAHRAHTRLTASGDSQTAGLTSAVRPSATLAVSGAQASMARQRDTVYRGRDTGYNPLLTLLQFRPLKNRARVPLQPTRKKKIQKKKKKKRRGKIHAGSPSSPDLTSLGTRGPSLLLT
jgi:hypothetical protein